MSVLEFIFVVRSRWARACSKADPRSHLSSRNCGANAPCTSQISREPVSRPPSAPSRSFPAFWFFSGRTTPHVAGGTRAARGQSQRGCIEAIRLWSGTTTTDLVEGPTSELLSTLFGVTGGPPDAQPAGTRCEVRCEFTTFVTSHAYLRWIMDRKAWFQELIDFPCEILNHPPHRGCAQRRHSQRPS